MAITIEQLTNEVIAQVSSLSAFTDPSVNKAFSIYDLDDLQTIAKFGGLPVVGVAYEGASVVDNDVVPVTRKAKAAFLYTVRFSVIIAIEYGSAVAGVDPKPDATNLLDETRGVLLGYQGVNNRPWRLSGESPVPGDMEGVIFYGQVWETDIPVIGKAF